MITIARRLVGCDKRNHFSLIRAALNCRLRAHLVASFERPAHACAEYAQSNELQNPRNPHRFDLTSRYRAERQRNLDRELESGDFIRARRRDDASWLTIRDELREGSFRRTRARARGKGGGWERQGTGSWKGVVGAGLPWEWGPAVSGVKIRPFSFVRAASRPLENAPFKVETVPRLGAPSGSASPLPARDRVPEGPHGSFGKLNSLGHRSRAPQPHR